MCVVRIIEKEDDIRLLTAFVTFGFLPWSEISKMIVLGSVGWGLGVCALMPLLWIRVWPQYMCISIFNVYPRGGKLFYSRATLNFLQWAKTWVACWPLLNKYCTVILFLFYEMHAVEYNFQQSLRSGARQLVQILKTECMLIWISQLLHLYIINTIQPIQQWQCRCSGINAWLGITIWNALSDDIKLIRSLYQFEATISDSLVANYVSVIL